MEEMHISVPTLDKLYEHNYFNKVFNIYLNQKDRFAESYEFVSDMGDELMVTYMSYFILIMGQILYKNSILEKIAKQNEASVEDQEKLNEYLIEMMEYWLVCFEDYCLGGKVSPQSAYKEYREEIDKNFINNPYVKKFMKETYNPLFKNAVKVYYLNNQFDLSKFGLEEDGEKLYDNTVYCIYCALEYSFHDLFKKNKRKVIKEIKSYPMDFVLEITNKCLDHLQNTVSDINDFVNISSDHVRYVKLIVSFVNSELNRLEIEDFQRNKKNNE